MIIQVVRLHDWVTLFIDGKNVFDGHDLPDHIFYKLLAELGATVVTYDVEGEPEEEEWKIPYRKTWNEMDELLCDEDHFYVERTEYRGD